MGLTIVCAAPDPAACRRHLSLQYSPIRRMGMGLVRTRPQTTRTAAVARVQDARLLTRTAAVAVTSSNHASTPNGPQVPGMQSLLQTLRGTTDLTFIGVARIAVGFLMLMTGVMQFAFPTLRAAWSGQLKQARIPFHTLNFWIVPVIEIAVGGGAWSVDLRFGADACYSGLQRVSSPTATAEAGPSTRDGWPPPRFSTMSSEERSEGDAPRATQFGDAPCSPGFQPVTVGRGPMTPPVENAVARSAKSLTRTHSRQWSETRAWCRFGAT